VNGAGEITRIKSIKSNKKVCHPGLDPGSRNMKEKTIVTINIFLAILMVCNSFFINKNLVCENTNNSKLVENLHFNIIQSSAMGSIITAQILGGKVQKDFADSIFTESSQTQKNIMAVLKDNHCKKYINWSQWLLSGSFILNIICLILLIILKDKKEK
jgi:hypothetical protein